MAAVIPIDGLGPLVASAHTPAAAALVQGARAVRATRRGRYSCSRSRPVRPSSVASRPMLRLAMEATNRACDTCPDGRPSPNRGVQVARRLRCWRSRGVRRVLPPRGDRSCPARSTTSAEEEKAVRRSAREALPNIRHEVQEVVVDGDVEMARGVVTGTLASDFAGVKGTGRSCEIDQAVIMHLRDRKIIEASEIADIAASRAQLAGERG